MAELTPERIHMTAEEFKTLPETTTPHELIDGELIVSPTPKDPHQGVIIDILRYLFQRITIGIFRAAPMEVHFDDGNIVEPDIFWVSGPESRCKLGDDGYWYSAPDLVIEVLSPSTEAKDRGAKFELYEKYGVGEYWLVNSASRYFEVFFLMNANFVRQGLFEAGTTFASRVLGQNIEVKAILGDKA